MAYDPCYVTASRCRDIASVNHGKLYGFRFHGSKRVSVDWFGGEVRRKFPSWGIAQKAVNQLRQGDGEIWDTCSLPD